MNGSDAIVWALVWVSGDTNCAVNAHRVSTTRAKVRTRAWKYASPLPYETASTIARSAVSSSVTGRNDASSFSDDVSFAIAFFSAFCVRVIGACLTAKKRQLGPSAGPVGRFGTLRCRTSAAHQSIFGRRRKIRMNAPRRKVASHEISWTRRF
jgi:hypothetical protein